MAKTVDRSAILREHIGNMIACGIAIYTAFTAFGGRRLFELSWQWELVTWVAPGVVALSPSSLQPQIHRQKG
ncbi:MAG: hypothetical protein U5L01_04895 [Rheinheimera sp.]|nr:hypothetical protein [Rheinheimera sp.]